MILDIFAVAIIAFCIYRGIKTGFVKAFFGTATLILAVVLTSATLSPAVEYVRNTSFGENIYEKTRIEIFDIEDFKEGQEFMDKFKLMEISESSDMLSDAEAFEEELSLNIGNIVIQSICSVALFILYTVLLKILSHIIDAVCKLPVLNTFNKAGGFLAGAVNAYIIMLVFTTVIMLLLPTGAGKFLTEQLDESYITAFIYSTNPFV